MTTISATTLRNNLASALASLETKKDYMLVASRGDIKSALVNIDLFEDLLALTNSKYLKSIKKAREEVKNKDIFSFNEVFGDL